MLVWIRWGQFVLCWSVICFVFKPQAGTEINQESRLGFLELGTKLSCCLKLKNKYHPLLFHIQTSNGVMVESHFSIASETVSYIITWRQVCWEYTSQDMSHVAFLHSDIFAWGSDLTISSYSSMDGAAMEGAFPKYWKNMHITNLVHKNLRP